MIEPKMTLEHAKGNLLEAPVEALVNTVNCVGFMGKGIALQFRQAFPANFAAYQRACSRHEILLGRMFITESNLLAGPRWIFNFPTKDHWRSKSRLIDIETGLQDLIGAVVRLQVKSIALPPLGCGLGGLNWKHVRPLIEAAFQQVPDVRVLLFAPEGAPKVHEMPIGTSRPHLTLARALFIKLMDRYKGLDYRLTLLELQKLAYFLQVAGEPLRLKYEKGAYGPYAENLNKVLETLEGHYTRGYSGERNPDVEIELMPGAVEEAEAFLMNHPNAHDRLARVADLIEGFETPYGMELLASVHWVAHSGAETSDDVLSHVHAWNERKQRVLEPRHVRVAWDHLRAKSWLHA